MTLQGFCALRAGCFGFFGRWPTNWRELMVDLCFGYKWPKAEVYSMDCDALNFWHEGLLARVAL